MAVAEPVTPRISRTLCAEVAALDPAVADGGVLCDFAAGGRPWAAECRPSFLQAGDKHRVLFEIYRELLAGDERNVVQMVSRDRDEALVWLANDRGNSHAVLVAGDAHIGLHDAICAMFACADWALVNFDGTEIVCFAPDVVSLAFFERLLAEAGARHDSAPTDDAGEPVPIKMWLGTHHEVRI